MSDMRHCRCCGQPMMSYLKGTDVNRHVSDSEFELWRCTSCGFIGLEDPPADLGRYYTSDYHFRPTRAEELDPHLEGQRFKIALLKRYVAGGALMEIGPSIGMFCKLAQDGGFGVSAIEMDEECARFIADALGVRAVVSDDPARVMLREGR
ncbi:MAG: hypothetical protein ACRCTI_18275, partial [Beijerinckiaceae bacterium]